MKEEKRPDGPEEGAQDILEAVRARMLARALPHVAEAGWEAALEQALEGEDADIGTLAFPEGAKMLALHFFAAGNRRMSEALGKADLSDMRIRDKIRTAVQLRLEVDSPHREAVRRGIAFLSLPGHMAAGAGCLYECVDSIWRGIGDRSTDFNFYSKRGILALVVGSTTLFWLEDASEGQEATWRFLDRRIEDVMAFEGAKARARGLFGGREEIWEMLGRLRYPG